MPQQPGTRHSLGIAATAVCLSMLAASIATRAWQAPAAQSNKPLVPVAASSLVLNPDEYIGATVSMFAAVERTFTGTTFSVDQDRTKSTGKDVLVIAPTQNAAASLNTYVTVVGEVIRFDPDDIARRVKGYVLDLPPDVVAKYRGKAVVLATSVINAQMTDIAKRVPPPMTPAEIEFSKVMKQVQPASTALRQAADGSNTELTRQHAAALKKNFSDAEAFFKTRGTADAIAWAQEAVKLMDTVDQATLAGKWDDVKTSSASLTQLCATCHAAHRERLDDGTYRVRGSR